MQLADQMKELTTVQHVNVQFNSTYVQNVEVYKIGYVVKGYCSFHKSTTEPDIAVITNLPKTVSEWGAVITPLRAHFVGGDFIRVHMNMGETVINLHYSTSWESTQGNEAELSFTYITAD